MDQEILQRGVQNLLRFWNLLIGVLNDENLPQMEKSLTVLILANDIVDTLTSSIAPLIIFGAMCSTSAPLDLIIWSILSWVILFISPVACVIILGAILPTWFAVSLPAYAKSCRFKNPPTCFFFVFLFLRKTFVLFQTVFG